MNARRRLLALATLALLATAGARACPPYPYVVDLWTALEPADAVVVVRVESVRPTARMRAMLAARSWLESTSEAVSAVWYDGGLVLEDAVSRLEEPSPEFDMVVDTQDVLLGEVPSRLTLGPVRGFFGRPAAGERVALFLALRNGRWILPHGTQSILPLPPAQAGPVDADQAIDDLRAAARVGKNIPEAGRVSPEALRDWLVLATALRGTRPYAISRLQREQGRLTATHQSILADAFLAERPDAYELQRWLDLFGNGADPAVFAHAAEIIETLRREDSNAWHWLAEALMLRLGVWTEKRASSSEEGRERLEVRWLELISGR